MFMQQIIINNTSGYLCKDIKINKEDFTYLYNKKMIIELNSLQEKKYKCKYFISEVKLPNTIGITLTAVPHE